MSKNEVFAKDADDCLIIKYSSGDEVSHGCKDWKRYRD